jgi:hypothetical protein
MEQRRWWRWGRVLSRRAATVGVAGVVVLALVGVFALRGSLGAGAGPNGAALTAGGPAAMVAADGLMLSLRISPGPYFLSELVAAQMTLINASGIAYQLEGAPVMNDCDQVMGVVLAGGQAPRYTVPTQGRVSCPDVSSTLHPGETWIINQLLPLTASGDVTLTAEGLFVVSGRDAHGNAFETGSEGPFAGHWPVLRLTVAPGVPAGRGISLRPISVLSIHRVGIAAPGGARGRLFAIADVTCHGDGSVMTEAPDVTWRLVSGDTLDEPGCPGDDEVWSYSVGAPGYAIVSGRYPARG